jgi:HSP20 family molecular chaperone IbpA
MSKYAYFRTFPSRLHELSFFILLRSPAAASLSRPQSIVPQTSPRVPGNTLPIASTSLSIQQTQQQYVPTPRRQEQPQPQQQAQQPQRRKYIIRTDGNYQPETGILTLMLELPGVDRRDVRVTLATNRCTRVRYLKVYGVVDPVLPPPKGEDMDMYPETVIRERKFGEFSRSFVVPAHLKVRHIFFLVFRMSPSYLPVSPLFNCAYTFFLPGFFSLFFFFRE